MCVCVFVEIRPSVVEGFPEFQEVGVTISGRSDFNA